MTNTIRNPHRITKAQRRAVRAISSQVGETPTTKVECLRTMDIEGSLFHAGCLYGAHGFVTGETRVWSADGSRVHLGTLRGFRFVQEGR